MKTTKEIKGNEQNARKYNKETIEVPDTMRVETWSYAEIEDPIELTFEEFVTKISDNNYDITSCYDDDILTTINSREIEIL